MNPPGDAANQITSAPREQAQIARLPQAIETTALSLIRTGMDRDGSD